MPPKIKHFAIYLAKILLLALIYHLGARLGLQMAYLQPNASPVWPPTGIAIAALLLFGLNLWPGISLGVLLGSVFTGAPLNLALGMAVGNTLEAFVIAYYLLRVIDLRKDLSRVQDVISLLSASFFGTMLSATIGTLTLMLTGLGDWEFFRNIWTTWWIGDLLGALVVAPFVLVWVTPSDYLASRRSYIEGALQLSLLGLITWYIFSNQPPTGVFHLALLYVIFPLTIWAALRFGQRGATTAVILVSGIAIWGTSQGMGPFSLESTNDSLILLQTFLGVLALTMLILAAATTERRKTADALHQRVNDLVTLNDSSKTFLDNFETASLYKTICKLAVERLGLELAWLEINHPGSPSAAVHGISASKLPELKEFWEAGTDFVQINGISVRTRSEHQSLDNPFLAFSVFPLTFGGMLIGSLKCLSKDALFFNADRLTLIQSYANLAAVAIQKTWLFGEVQITNKQLHALSQRLIKAQEEERLHLSREIHDESGQLLSALTFNLGLLEREPSHSETVLQRIAELKRTTQEIQANLHQLAVRLRPASLDHLGLATALQQYIQDFNRQYDINVEFEAVGFQVKRLPVEVETALFRIIQESLTNVALHAQARRVDVLINIRNDQIVAVIEDDGIGFIPGSITVESQLGLFGMRERVEMLGGQMTIESSPGKGTSINVEVPYHD